MYAWCLFLYLGEVHAMAHVEVGEQLCGVNSPSVGSADNSSHWAWISDDEDLQLLQYRGSPLLPFLGAAVRLGIVRAPTCSRNLLGAIHPLGFSLLLG